MHPPHNWLLDYFWLFSGLWCGVGGALMLQFRLRRGIAAGVFTSEEVTSFATRMAFCILLPTVVLWVLQMSMGTEATPFFVTWPQPQFLAALAIQLCLWVALLYWIFVRDGALTASRFLTAAARKPSVITSPVLIKVQAVAVVVAGIAALMLAPRA